MYRTTAVRVLVSVSEFIPENFRESRIPQCQSVVVDEIKKIHRVRKLVRFGFLLLAPRLFFLGEAVVERPSTCQQSRFLALSVLLFFFSSLFLSCTPPVRAPSQARR